MYRNDKYCLEVEARLSKENFMVNSKDNDTKVSLEIKASDELRRDSSKKQNVNLCLVLDKSYSMKTIVDEENITPIPGVRNVEGSFKNMSTTGTSRLMVAVDAAMKIVDLMEPEDTISCIVFADDPVLLFKDMTGKQKTQIKHLLDYHGSVKKVSCGLNTNISGALYGAQKVLNSNKSESIKKIIFLTDGQPKGDTKEKGIAQAKSIANSGITLDCVGFGTTDSKCKDQVDFAFLQALAAPSNGKSELIYDAQSINGIFTGRMKKAQEVLITDAKLHLTFSNTVRATEHYRATPENTYLGKVKLDKNRQMTLNLGQIEKNQMYKYFIQLNVPGKDYLGDFSILKAEVEYKIPSIYGQETVLTKMKAKVNKTELLTDSFKLEGKSVNEANVARRKDGEIESKYMLAEIKRLEAEAEIARQANEKHAVVSIYKKIIQIYTNLQNMQEAKMYEELLNSYVNGEEFNYAAWNKITSTTSQSSDSGVLIDLTENEYGSFIDMIDPDDDI